MPKRQKVIARVCDRRVFEDCAYEAEITRGLKKIGLTLKVARASPTQCSPHSARCIEYAARHDNKSRGDVLSNAKMSAAQFRLVIATVLCIVQINNLHDTFMQYDAGGVLALSLLPCSCQALLLLKSNERH